MMQIPPIELLPDDLLDRSIFVDPDQKHRYWMSGEIPEEEANPNRLNDPPDMLLFVIDHPRSVTHADAVQRRLDKFAIELGARRYGIISLFARATPTTGKLFKGGFNNALGMLNNLVIKRALEQSRANGWRVVCAWGNPSMHPTDRAAFEERAMMFMHFAMGWETPLYALARTAGRYPAHPMSISPEGASLVQVWQPGEGPT